MPTSPPPSGIPAARRDEQRRLSRAIQPLTRFLDLEASSGILLFTATVAALLWANSPWRGAYHRIWETPIALRAGSLSYDADLHHLVDDGLMALFFFVVGMEIKRELVAGQMRGVRRAALPGFAAAGGMIVPALVYLAFNASGGAAHGWGIPMATDIAFALGVVAILGALVPPEAKVLLLSLAIVDDIGAIAVIAVFYSASLHLAALAVAGVLVVVLAAAHRLGIRHPLVLVLLAITLWFATERSGIHPTIAGVAIGFLTPAHAGASDRSACDRLIDLFHPWTSFVVVPIFALANAGVSLSASTIRPSRVSVGVAAGLVLGKLVGIGGATALAVRLRLAEAPAGLGPRHVAGVAALGGIGFTVALFITGLAFDDPTLADQARVGALGASVVAATLGALAFARSRPAQGEPARSGNRQPM